MTENLNDKIIIYQNEDGKIQPDVKLGRETVWLTQVQMVELFQTSKQNVSLYINNIYKEGELEKEATVKDYLTVQSEGARIIHRRVNYCNLDMTISVGYRVNTKRGIRFCQWVNPVLKQYLIKGYAINEDIRKYRITELRQLIQVLDRTIQRQPAKTTGEGNALFNVVVDYIYALGTLDNYDYQRLHTAKITREEPFHVTYENVMHEIDMLRQRSGGSILFGNEKDESFKSSIGQTYQTFDGTELYPSVEKKAAMLLYLITKSHSLSDGNKRIVATLFLWLMNNNAILYHLDGTKQIVGNTPVALTLMTAENRTEEKDTMVKVVADPIDQAN